MLVYTGGAMLRYSRKRSVFLASAYLAVTALSIQSGAAESIVLSCSQWNRTGHSFTVIIDKQARSIQDTCSMCSGPATVLRMDDNLMEYDVRSGDGTVWRTWLYPDGNYKTQHIARNGTIIPETEVGADGGHCTRSQRVY
jgi:hypothetical protein